MRWAINDWVDLDHPDTGRWIGAWLYTLRVAGESPHQLERRSEGEPDRGWGVASRRTTGP